MIQVVPVRTEQLSKRIFQPLHGFIHGKFVFLNTGMSPSQWELAVADQETTTSLGMVINSNTDYFDLVIAGRAEWNAHGLNLGRFYYLSPDNPGDLVAVPPGQVPGGGSPLISTTDLIIPVIKVIDVDTVQVIFQGPSGGAVSAASTFGYTRLDFNSPAIISGDYWDVAQLFVPESPTLDMQLILDANIDTPSGVIDTTLRLRTLISTNGSDDRCVVSLTEHECNSEYFPFDQMSILIDDVDPNIYHIMLRASSEITEIQMSSGRSFLFYRAYNQDGELLSGGAPPNNLAPVAFDPTNVISAVTGDMDAYMPLWTSIDEDLEDEYATQGYFSLKMAKVGQSPGGWSWVNTKSGPFVFNTLPTFRGTPLINSPQIFEFGEANSNAFGAQTIQFIDPNNINNRFAAFYADKIGNTALYNMNLNDAAGSAMTTGANPTNRIGTHDQKIFNTSGNWEQDGNRGFRINGGVGTYSLNFVPNQHQSDIIHYQIRWSGAPGDGIQAIVIAGAPQRVAQNPVSDGWFLRRDGNDLTMDKMVSGVFQNINPQVISNFFLGVPDYTPIDLWVVRYWKLNTNITAPIKGNIYNAQNLVVYSDVNLTNEIMRELVGLDTGGPMVGVYHQTANSGLQNVTFGNITTYLIPADHFLQNSFDTGVPGTIPSQFLGSTGRFKINTDSNIEVIDDSEINRGIYLEDSNAFGTSYQFQCEFKLGDDDNKAAININHDILTDPGDVLVSGFFVIFFGATSATPNIANIYAREPGATSFNLVQGSIPIPYNLLSGEWHIASILVHDRPPMDPANIGITSDSYDDDLWGTVILNGIPIWTGAYPTVARVNRIHQTCGVLSYSVGTEYRKLKQWACHHYNQIPNTINDSASGFEGKKEIGTTSTSGGWMGVPSATYNGRSGFFLEGKWASDLQFDLYGAESVLRTFAFAGTWFRQPDDVANTGRASLFRGFSVPGFIGDIRRDNANGLYYALSTAANADGFNRFYIPGGASNAEHGGYVPHAAIVKSATPNNIGFIGGQIINGDANDKGISARARLMGNPNVRCLCFGFALYQYTNPTDTEYQQIELSMIDYIRN